MNSGIKCPHCNQLPDISVSEGGGLDVIDESVDCIAIMQDGLVSKGCQCRACEEFFNIYLVSVVEPDSFGSSHADKLRDIAAMIRACSDPGAAIRWKSVGVDIEQHLEVYGG